MRLPSLALVLACSSVALSQAARTGEPQDVSLIQLIAEPERYEGKLVRVLGFIRLEFEGKAIYLHREDYEHGLSQNALWLDAEKCIDRADGNRITTGYAIVEGTFTSTQHGHMDMFAGEIQNVRRCEKWR